MGEADPSRRGGSQESPAGGWQQSVRAAAPYLGLGVELAVTMALCTGAGYWADQWLGTLPWCTLAGAALGMTAAFVHVFRISKKMSEPSEDEEDGKV